MNKKWILKTHKRNLKVDLKVDKMGKRMNLIPGWMWRKDRILWQICSAPRKSWIEFQGKAWEEL